jgi:hypothetical protein
MISDTRFVEAIVSSRTHVHDCGGFVLDLARIDTKQLIRLYGAIREEFKMRREPNGP